MQVYDLSISLHDNMLSYTKDPAFQKKTIFSFAKGDSMDLTEIELSSHAGTHIDFPSHMINTGKTSNDYKLKDLCGNGIIVEVPENVELITEKIISNIDVKSDDIIFFKTNNSKFIVNQLFTENYTCFDPAAAQALVDKKIKIIGIDYLSVDKYENQGFVVHKKFLSNGCLIVENLNLSEIPAGRYNIFICPIKTEGVEGAPARVFAMK